MRVLELVAGKGLAIQAPLVRTYQREHPDFDLALVGVYGDPVQPLLRQPRQALRPRCRRGESHLVEDRGLPVGKGFNSKQRRHRY